MKPRILRVLFFAAAAAGAAITSLTVAEASSSRIASIIPGHENQSTTDPAGTVSWQSVFWPLVILALNSCLQQPADICGIDAELGFLVKSSPVFCGIDAVLIWGQTVYYLTKVHPRTALRVVASSRNQHVAVQNETSIRSIIRWLLVVASLLEAVKLYSLRGIPWTHTIGSTYLLSYATNGLLIVLGRPQTAPDPTKSVPKREDTLPSRTVVRDIAVVAAYLQVLMWTVVVRFALPEQTITTITQGSWRLPVDAATLVFITPLLILAVLAMNVFFATVFIDAILLLLPSAIVFLALEGLRYRCLPSAPDPIARTFGCTRQTVINTIAIMLAVVGALVQVCFGTTFPVTRFYRSDANPVWQPINYLLDAEHWDEFTPYGLALLILAVPAVLSFGLHKAFFKGSISRKLGITNGVLSSNLGWACLLMLFGDVSMAYVYYGHVFSSEGTWRPAWTEYLG